MASISKEHRRRELRGQIEATSNCLAGLKQLRFWRRSCTGRRTSEHGGNLSISSVRTIMRARRVVYDLAIIEPELAAWLGERNRPLVNSMRSSVSAKAGKFAAL